MEFEKLLILSILCCVTELTKEKRRYEGKIIIFELFSCVTVINSIVIDGGILYGTC